MAFGHFNQGSQSVMADINVTPLVDVMLVLLIVFMITMPVLTNSIPIELPTANVEQQQEPKNIVRISLNSDGIYVDNKSVSQEELTQILQQSYQQDEQSVVAIAADVAIEYRHIISVLELAQQIGLKKIGFVTEPKE